MRGGGGREGGDEWESDDALRETQGLNLEGSSKIE